MYIKADGYNLIDVTALDNETLYHESENDYSFIVMLTGLVATSDRDNVAQIIEDAVDDWWSDKNDTDMCLSEYVHVRLDEEGIEHIMFTEAYGREE